MPANDAAPESSRPFDLIAFDLDGTVFASPNNQLVSPRVYAAFQAAHDSGALVAVASGRPLWMIGEQIPEAPWLDYAITCNGARVVGTRRSDLDFSHSIPRPLAEKLLALITEYGGTGSIHTDVESLMEKRHCEKIAQDLAERDAKTDDAAAHSGSPASNEGRGNPIDAVLSLFSGSGVDSMLDAFLARPTQQLDKVDCTMPSSESADKLIAKLTELGGIGIARMDAKTPEFTSTAASKGAALVELCRRLGIVPSRAVAFGDSGNDLSMCGRGITFVAMGNATAEVKAAADDQTDTVWEDGVATWLEPRLGISAPEASA